MSHTLIYYRRAARAEPTAERLLAFLDGLPHVTRHGEAGHYQCVYANPTTGVDFVLDYVDPDEADAAEEARQFAGLAPLGLTASVEYLRPSFFGLEAMAWLDHIRGELDLRILDPQSGVGSAAGPAAHDLDALIGSYDAANARATRTLLEQETIEMDLCPRDFLEAWWRYQMAVPDLEEHYGDRVEVPPPELVHDPRGEVTTVVRWRFFDPAVFPVDVRKLAVERERRRFGLVHVVEKGAAPAADLFATLSSGIRRLEDPYPHLLFVPESLSLADQRAAAALPLDPRATFTRVNPARLTDVAPGA